MNKTKEALKIQLLNYGEQKKEVLLLYNMLCVVGRWNDRMYAVCRGGFLHVRAYVWYREQTADLFLPAVATGQSEAEQKYKIYYSFVL